MRCRLRYGSTIERESARVLCLMTQRRRLDAFLVEQAAAAGAEFRDGVHVDVESDTELRVDGKPDRGRRADRRRRRERDRPLDRSGSAGRSSTASPSRAISRTSELPAGRWRGHARPRARRCARRLRLDLPEGRPRQRRRRRLGSRRPAAARAPACPLRALRHRARASSSDLRGHRLPMRRPGTCSRVAARSSSATRPGRSTRSRATASTKRSSRRGSPPSTRSRSSPATTETLEPYQAAVRRELDPLASAGWGAKVALDRYPRAVFTLMRLPVTWRRAREAPARRGLPSRGGPGRRRTSHAGDRGSRPPGTQSPHVQRPKAPR